MSGSKVRLGNGTEISYIERQGSGEVILLLHGISDSAATYEPLLNRIDADHRVIAMDFRGHGSSSRSSAPYTTTAYVDDVIRFIDEVVQNPVRLAGHSLGGWVAAHVAARSPEQVVSAFLEDPPLYFVGNMNETYEMLFQGIVMMATTLQDGSKSKDDWFEVMAAAPDPYSGKPGIETMGEERIRLRLDAIGRMDPKALQDALDGSLETGDVDEMLSRIRCPVTLLNGNASLGAVITTEESERAVRNMADASLVQATDVGHMIHDEAADIWLAEINRWAAP